MTTKHTPAPWRIGTKNGYRIWSENGETLVAIASASASLRNETIKANARLIDYCPRTLQSICTPVARSKLGA
jgi:hypothetical protein